MPSTMATTPILFNQFPPISDSKLSPVGALDRADIAGGREPGRACPKSGFSGSDGNGVPLNSALGCACAEGTLAGPRRTSADEEVEVV